jgi:membrane fusion protein, heavy metal efflux system
VVAARQPALRDPAGGPDELWALSGHAPIAALPSGPQSVELNDKQLASVKVETVGEYVFPVERVAVGSIDFNEELTVQVFTPYQGKIMDLFAKVGDEVKQGQTLFTIDSPDLLAADSNLIAAAGVLDLTTRNVERLKKLYETRAVSQHDLEQAVSDQQTAERNLRSARDAVRIFGKSEGEVNKIVAERMADPRLVVPSPIAGRVTARNAAPGLLVQPGNAPAPYSVADISTMWMLANVAESDVPLIHLGQEVKVSVLADPGKAFEGHITRWTRWLIRTPIGCLSVRPSTIPITTCAPTCSRPSPSAPATRSARSRCRSTARSVKATAR